jgi:hypothetical protein
MDNDSFLIRKTGQQQMIFFAQQGDKERALQTYRNTFVDLKEKRSIEEAREFRMTVLATFTAQVLRYEKLSYQALQRNSPQADLLQDYAAMMRAVRNQVLYTRE